MKTFTHPTQQKWAFAADDLQGLIKQVCKTLPRHIKRPDVWVTRKTKRTQGNCRSNSGGSRIMLSYGGLESGQKQVILTILHELAHLNCPAGTGHKKKWAVKFRGYIRLFENNSGIKLEQPNRFVGDKAFLSLK